MVALSYATVGSNDLKKAKAFYDALLGSVGMASVFEHPSGGRLYGKDGKLMFGVMAPHDGKPASVGNGSMSGFTFKTREEVDAFYKTALALGAKDDGAPGERGPGFYFSYFRDPDGNKLCAYKLG